MQEDAHKTPLPFQCVPLALNFVIQKGKNSIKVWKLIALHDELLLKFIGSVVVQFSELVVSWVLEEAFNPTKMKHRLRFDDLLVELFGQSIDWVLFGDCIFDKPDLKRS